MCQTTAKPYEAVDEFRLARITSDHSSTFKGLHLGKDPNVRVVAEFVVVGQNVYPRRSYSIVFMSILINQALWRGHCIYFPMPYVLTHPCLYIP